MRKCIDSMTPLKPCPFCLSDGERLLDLWDRFDAGHVAHVHCYKCGASGPSIYSEQSADVAIKRARWAWNGRAQTCDLAAQPKEPTA